VKHAIVGISEDNKHDADAVLEFEKQALDIVSKDIHIQIKEIHQWTDGCAAQYKGKKSIADISLRNKPSICRNFFETSHGKNICVGLGAIVKNFCYQAVISSKKIIGTAQDVFDHCEQRLTSIKSQTEGEEKTVSKRQFILVKGIKRDRPETNVNTLKGTRKLHAVRSTGHDYKLETRKLSCYCLNCLEEIDQCQNIDYCHRWETQTLKVLKSTTRKQLENMETEQDSMEEEDMEIDHLENTDSNQQENIEMDQENR
jgi:rRNA processing protein Gar1